MLSKRCSNCGQVGSKNATEIAHDYGAKARLLFCPAARPAQLSLSVSQPPGSNRSHLIRAEKNYYVEFSSYFFAVKKESSFFFWGGGGAGSRVHGAAVAWDTAVSAVSRAHDSGVNNFISRAASSAGPKDNCYKRGTRCCQQEQQGQQEQQEQQQQQQEQ